MKLTIEQVAKLTKLSVPTLRVYASRQKLGTKVGNRRVFSQAEVQELLKSSKKSGAKSKGAAHSPARPAKKKTQARVSKRPRAAAKPATAKSPPARTSTAQSAAAKPSTAKPMMPMAKPEKRSFWQSIFGARKPKEKVKLLEAKTK